MGYNTNGKNGSSKPKGGNRFNDAVFINWSLSADEKATVKGWQPTADELDDIALKIIQESCKITFGYDERGNAFTCSLVPQQGHKTNKGYILVGRGSTPIKAFKQAVFIHTSVFHGDWSSYSTGQIGEEMDD